MARPVTKLKQIESTAIWLIALRGLSQVTIKDIAREAGCAEGALYRHYRSKEEMAWVLFRREVERFGKHLREILLDTPGKLSARIRSAVALFYGFFDDERTAFSFILLTRHDFPPEWQIAKKYNPDDIVKDFVAFAARSGSIRIPDHALAAAMILGLVLQPATMAATGKLKGTLRERIPIIAEACCKVLGIRERSKQ